MDQRTLHLPQDALAYVTLLNDAVEADSSFAESTSYAKAMVREHGGTYLAALGHLALNNLFLLRDVVNELPDGVEVPGLPRPVTTHDLLALIGLGIADAGSDDTLR